MLYILLEVKSMRVIPIAFLQQSKIRICFLDAAAATAVHILSKHAHGKKNKFNSKNYTIKSKTPIV